MTSQKQFGMESGTGRGGGSPLVWPDRKLVTTFTVKQEDSSRREEREQSAGVGEFTWAGGQITSLTCFHLLCSSEEKRLLQGPDMDKRGVTNIKAGLSTSG